MVEELLFRFRLTLEQRHRHFDDVALLDAAALHGFGGWFRAELAPGIELSNAHGGAPMWLHKFLPLEAPVPIDAGMTIAVEPQSHDGIDWRWRGAAGSVPFRHAVLTFQGRKRTSIVSQSIHVACPVPVREKRAERSRV